MPHSRVLGVPITLGTACSEVPGTVYSKVLVLATSTGCTGCLFGTGITVLHYLVFLLFLRLILRDSRFLSLYVLPSVLAKGVVWRGWMTSLLCLFRIASDASSPGVGHS